MSKKFELLAATALAALIAAPQAHAQSAAETSTVEEIVVTARKRTESLQDVPISIAAVTAADIEAKGATRLSDVLDAMPNVQFDKNALGGADVSIRGIQSSTNNLGIESAVGLYVDEVYLSRPAAFNQSALDIERIEVLRGPQGTLFGRNTVAGVINITTADPTDTLTARGDVTLGSENFRQARGSVSGPLGETLGFRISASRIKSDGWFENTAPGFDDLGFEDSSAVRVKLRWAPSDAFDATLSYDASDDRSAQGHLEIKAGPLAAFTDGINDSFASNIDNVESRQLRIGALRMNWRAAGHTLTSVTAYQTIKYNRFNDQDYTALDILATGSLEKDDFFSQELRIASERDGPFSYVAGAYYSKGHVEGGTYGSLGSSVPPLFAGMNIPGYIEQVRTTSKLESDAFALFASGTWEIDDQWVLAGGLRYTREEKSLDYVQVITPFFIAPGVPVGIIYGFAADVPRSLQNYDDSAWSGDASLTYRFSPDVNAYARFSRGYKAGGFDSTQSASSNPGDLSFDPEFVNLYEVGFKSLLADRRVRFNASAFFMDYSNKQEQLFDGVNFLTGNAAEAEIKGAEAELTFRATQGLRFDFGLGYADATYGTFVDPLAGSDYSGNRLPGSAEWSGSAAAEYSFPIGDAFKGYVRGEAIYRSDMFTTSDNDPDFQQEGHTLLNARVGIEREDGRLGLYVWGRNLTDERYVTAGFNFLGTTYIERNRPRTWGVELRARY